MVVVVAEVGDVDYGSVSFNESLFFVVLDSVVYGIS